MSCAEPFTIYGTETTANEFLGFRGWELQGQSLSCLCGPWTDWRLLVSLISNCALDRIHAMMRMCDRSQTPRDFKVTSSPLFDFSQNLFVAILSFEEGKQIESVLKNSTAEGFTQKVLQKEKGIECHGYFDSKKSCSLSVDESRSSVTGSGNTLEQNCQDNVVTINARRKLGAFRPIPVAVTLELVAKLQHLPAHLAAARIGISPAALKRACRKLGVPRWAYKKKTRSELSPPSPTSAPHIDPQSPNSIALWEHAPGFPSFPDNSTPAPSMVSDNSATPTDPDSSSDGSPEPALSPNQSSMPCPDDLLWLAAFDPQPSAPDVDLPPLDSDGWRDVHVRCEGTQDWGGEEAAADNKEWRLLCGDLFGWAEYRSADS